MSFNNELVRKSFCPKMYASYTNHCGTNGMYCMYIEKCYVYIFVQICSGTTGGKPKITRSNSRQFSLADVISGIYGYDTYQTDWISGLLSLSFSLIYSSYG